MKMMKSYFLVYDNLTPELLHHYFKQHNEWDELQRVYELLLANKGDKLFRFACYRHLDHDRDLFNKYKNINFKFEHSDLYYIDDYTLLLNVHNKIYLIARDNLMYPPTFTPKYYVPDLPGVFRKICETNFKCVDYYNDLHSRLIPNGDKIFINTAEDLDMYKQLWDDHIEDIKWMCSKSAYFNNYSNISHIFDPTFYTNSDTGVTIEQNNLQYYCGVDYRSDVTRLDLIKPGIINTIRNTKAILKINTSRNNVVKYKLLKKIFNIKCNTYLEITDLNIDLVCELLDHVNKSFSFYTSPMILMQCRLDKQVKKEKAKEQKIDVIEKKEPWWYKFV